MTDAELQRHCDLGLARLLALLYDGPRIEAELTVIEATVRGTQRLADDRPCEPVTLGEYNGRIN